MEPMVVVAWCLAHQATLLQNTIDIITNCDGYFITRCGNILLQNSTGALLQNGTVLLQNTTILLQMYQF